MNPRLFARPERRNELRLDRVPFLWTVCLLALAGSIFALPACERGPSKAARSSHVLIVGFDGVDPVLFERWRAKGELPNLDRLAREGLYVRFRSTNPPQSPVAWTSFATGTNPGRHGIYDFIGRDPASYQPFVATTDLLRPTFDAQGKLLKPPAGVNRRKGTPFWVELDRAKLKTCTLNVPYTFPPDPLTGGEMISGLGVPDVRGTNSTFAYYASDLEPSEDGKTVSGGKLFRLVLHQNKAESIVEGPLDARAPTAARLTVPLAVERDPQTAAIRVSLGERTETIGEGKFSDWFSAAFPMGPDLTYRGICRIYVLSAGPEVRLYLTPMSFDPRSPPIPISSPVDLTARLAAKLGLFKTVGWSEDTSALNTDRIPEKVFLEDMFTIVEEQERRTLEALADGPWNLFITAFTMTDRSAHMFWRLLDERSPLYDRALADEYGSAVLASYRRADTALGKILAAAPEGTKTIVLSDHGFHSFRKGVNVNTWLLRHCYMSLTGKGCGESLSTSDIPSEEFFTGVDWSRTKAYAMGTGQVYLNRLGREGKGIVGQGEVDPLEDEIAKGLREIRDPNEGDAPVVRNVYRGDRIFMGQSLGSAPDLQVAFAEGYRTSWAAVLGGFDKEIVVANNKKWSGDHAASDVEDTPGILITNLPLAAKEPGILDIAPTVLKIFGLPIPPEMDGKPLI